MNCSLILLFPSSALKQTEWSGHIFYPFQGNTIMVDWRLNVASSYWSRHSSTLIFGREMFAKQGIEHWVELERKSGSRQKLRLYLPTAPSSQIGVELQQAATRSRISRTSSSSSSNNSMQTHSSAAAVWWNAFGWNAAWSWKQVSWESPSCWPWIKTQFI